MLWISFANTIEPFKKGIQTVTRRYWNDKYAEGFWNVACENGGLAIACSRSQQWGGKRIGLIRVTKKPYRQKLEYITDADEIKSGHMWGNAKDYISFLGGPELEPWVIEFEAMPDKQL
jgi:hypothetical protein